MKTSKTREGQNEIYRMDYDDFPLDKVKTARIIMWENGEGFDVYLGDDKVELSTQEMVVLEILFAHTRLIGIGE